MKISYLLMSLLLCVGFTAQAQNLTITGKVTSEEDPTGLPGVNVLVKGTSTGTVTDISGSYSLEVPGAESVLVFSSVGFIQEEVAVGNNTVIDMVMTADITALEEIVVVGYGSERKVNLTGSVGTVKSEDLTQVPTANATGLLAGRIPGVIVKQNSGLPGSENLNISIRGYGNPLILVDGVQLDGGFSRIDQNEIESISVLKDASAAVYGARAANGVILVTTKRGKIGKPAISYDGSLSFQEATAFQDYVNPGQYVELVREADFNDNGDFDLTFTGDDLQKYMDGVPGYEGGDWKDALIDNFAPMTQHSLKVSGGTDNVRYFTSIGATDQESYFSSRDHDYKRYNIRTNIDVDVSERISFNVDLAYRHDQRTTARDVNGIFNDLGTAQPIYPTTLPDPDIGVPYTGFSQRNPVASATRSDFGWDDRIDYTFTGKMGFNYKLPFLDGLSLRGELNVVQLNRQTKKFRDSYHVLQYDPEADDYIDQGFNRPETSISDQQFRRQQIYPLIALEYEKQFGEHSIKALALGEQITREQSSVFASRTNLLSASIPEIFSGSEDFDETNGSSNADIGRKSFVARINYRFKDRYLFESTFRADGNVRFAPETRWGYFPSFSAGWIISEESFMQGAGNVLDDLKIRASYTQLGDDRAEGILGFDYLTGYTQSGIPSYLLNGELKPSIRTLGLVNPALTWVESATYNVGMEAGFLEGKLQMEVDLFYRDVTGILGQNTQAIPSTFGGELPLVNLNSKSNRGIDLLLSYQDKFGDVKINISPNFTYARAKWGDVLDEEVFVDPDELRIYGKSGQWQNRNFGYVSDGIFMSQGDIDDYPVIQDGIDNSSLRPGDIRFKDLDGNDTINFRDQDVIAYANGLPEITYGMNLGATYKRFGMNVLLQGASHFSLHVTGAARDMFANSSTPFSYHYDLRWQPDTDNPGVNINPNAQLPAAATTASSNNNRNSDFYRKDVSYLRIRNVNLYYNLHDNIASRIGLTSAQIYVAAENLVTFSNLGIYKNSFDPESTGTNPSRTYPINRSYTVGLRVTL